MGKNKDRDLAIPNVTQVTSNVRRALEIDISDQLGREGQAAIAKKFRALARLERDGATEGHEEHEAELERQCLMLAEVYEGIAAYAQAASEGFELPCEEGAE